MLKEQTTKTTVKPLSKYECMSVCNRVQVCIVIGV